MQEYSVLLVDDEEDIRQRTRRRVDWKSTGFYVVDEAENGIEALDKIEKHRPDIVITDIKMPFMDGIKLAQNIKDRYPTIKVIVISGFDEFEYAQKAINIGVIQYVLKPINAAEMKALLLKTRNILDNEYTSRNNLEQLRKNYEKSLPVLRERFLNQWIEEYTTQQVIQEQQQVLDLDMIGKSMTLAVIRRDVGAKVDESEQALKHHILMKFAVFNICEEVNKRYGLGTLFMRREEMILLVNNERIQGIGGSEYLLRGLEEIRETVEKYLDTTVTIGVGDTCRDLSRLYKTYQHALGALEYSLTLGHNKVLCIEDIEPGKGMFSVIESIDDKQLITAIKMNDKTQIVKAVETIVHTLQGNPLNIGDYQLGLIEILINLVKLMNDMHVDTATLLVNDSNLLHTVSKLKTQTEIKAWLIEMATGIAHTLSKHRKHTSNELIQKAKDYIHMNYKDEQLSAECICKYLHISTNYFSALFKREMEMTFMQYVTDLRIEKAKALLTQTKMKAFEIGNEVGYTESHYFSYVFKKVTGMTPMEYRNGTC